MRDVHSRPEVPLPDRAVFSDGSSRPSLRGDPAGAESSPDVFRTFLPMRFIEEESKTGLKASGGKNERHSDTSQELARVLG